MPVGSKRSQEAHASPIRKLAKYADAAKRAGKKVWHLNIGQPDIVSPEAALEAVRAANLDQLAYSPSAGIASYRASLPSYYQKFGISLSPNDIVVTNGASEAIFFTLLACMEAGECLLTPEPCYANYLGFAGMASVEVNPLPTFIVDGFALPSVEAFSAAITPTTKAVMLCNPNNPTGTVYPESMLRAIGEVVLEKDLFLIVDEV